MILSKLIEESYVKNAVKSGMIEEGALKGALIGAGLGLGAMSVGLGLDDMHMDHLEHTDKEYNDLYGDKGILKDNNINNNELNTWNKSHSDQQFNKPEDLQKYANNVKHEYMTNKDDIFNAQKNGFQSRFDHFKNWWEHDNSKDQVGKHIAYYGLGGAGIGGAALGAILNKNKR